MSTARDYPRIVVPPPGPKARDIVSRDSAWASTSYIKEYPLAIAGGRGVMVEDVDGNRYLDLMAGIAVASTGYGHPEVIAAIKSAADKFLHICGSDFYYEGMAAVCERLAKIAPGPSRKRVFLTNSGTEAVEGAIKLARHSTRRTGLVSFKGAFHGRTYGSMSLTSSKAKQHAGFTPLLPEVYHIPFGYCYRCDFSKTFPSCNLFCVSSIEHDLFARDLDPQDVAAIFVEPVQGEGGYVVPPPGYLTALRELCDKHGILLVFDEIQSGVGRTGKMWAAEHAGVEPDILLTAKGLASGMPLGAIIAKESIMHWGTGSHGSTFGGNPVCCAAALATLDVVERELVANAVARGEQLLAGVRELAKRHESIGDVRGLGLMIGVEFVKDRTTREPHPQAVRDLVNTAFSKGLLLLGCGKSTLRLAPPLVIDAQDVDTGLQLIDECLATIK
ncbi:MAG TPA: acetyl ornithine aminotransferase family protein [Gemmatimonadaceae bacterium]|nr:acetyl ornithine aminotransferase family protein [Gemmatimonadaceae bacterium]